jgi:NAD(P)-dependent dehydrogenase (short-subunit alcohol dehydrogenase family)
MRPLESKVALVAGATRGAGRGIAVMLGEAGATVYCTGRSSRTGRPPPASGGGGPFDLSRRPETIEETAELTAARGGEGIAVCVDHTDEAQVEALIARIAEERGRLDVLVNDIWGGDHLTEWGKPFWEQTPAKGLEMVERVLRTHVITSRHAVPLMLKNRVGLVVEVTDGDFLGYRGNHFYDMAKLVPIRLAYAMASDFGSHRAPEMTALAVTPGFLRSEAMLEHLALLLEFSSRPVGQDEPRGQRKSGETGERCAAMRTSRVATPVALTRLDAATRRAPPVTHLHRSRRTFVASLHASTHSIRQDLPQ